MAPSKKEIRVILAAVSAAVDSMTDEELDMLSKGSGVLRFYATTSKKKPGKSYDRVPDIGDVAEKLANAATLEEARDVLTGIPKSGRRKHLVDLAAKFRVHITKRDTVPTIEERIIESVVGARMRSETMLSLPF